MHQNVNRKKGRCPEKPNIFVLLNGVEMTEQNGVGFVKNVDREKQKKVIQLDTIIILLKIMPDGEERDLF